MTQSDDNQRLQTRKMPRQEMPSLASAKSRLGSVGRLLVTASLCVSMTPAAAFASDAEADQGAPVASVASEADQQVEAGQAEQSEERADGNRVSDLARLALPSPTYDWYTSPAQAGTYVLSTQADFAGFANLVNGTAKVEGVSGPVDFKGCTVTLATPLNFRGETTCPIGADGNVFAGTFDGGGNTIAGLNIVNAEEVGNIGLFGTTAKDSVIKNVVMNSCTVKVTTDKAVLAQNIGLVAGNAGGDVTNCSTTKQSSVVVTANADATESVPVLIMNVGGVVGLGTGDMTDNANAASVSVSALGGYASGDLAYTVWNIGGVAGSAGSVDATLDKNSPKLYGSFSDCSNSGTVTVNTPKNMGSGLWSDMYVLSGNIGGVAGYVRGNASSLANSGSISSDHGSSVSGVVGGLHAPSTLTGYNGMATVDDEGVSAKNTVTLSRCTNTGNVQGYVAVGGVVGRAGSYTVVYGCSNGRMNPQNECWVAGARANKPMVGGVAGSSYGDIAFCMNTGNVGTGFYNASTGKFSQNSGYHCGGIAGALQQYKNDDNSDKTPRSQAYSCMNVGQLYSLGGRTRNIAGLNEDGVVYDCVALANLVHDANEANANQIAFENMEGVNAVVSVSQLKNNEVLSGSEYQGLTPIGILNRNGDDFDWSTYFVLPTPSTVNGGFPVLNGEAGGVAQNPVSIDGAAVSCAAPAAWLGVPGAIPTMNVVVGGKQLKQNVDFCVVPQETAVDMGDGYVAAIQGIGAYTGQTTGTYRIGKGSLANFRVSADAVVFDWNKHVVTSSDVSVMNGDVRVDPSEYTVSVSKGSNPGDPDLVDGAMVNAGGYTLTVTATPNAPHVEGTGTGAFYIQRVPMNWDTEEPGGGSDNAHPTQILTPTGWKPWQSARYVLLNDPNTQQEIAVTYPYTGHPIVPEVKVAYRGKEIGTQVTGIESEGIVQANRFTDRRNRVVEQRGFLVVENDASQAVPDNIGSPTQKTIGSIYIAGVMYTNFQGNDGMEFYIDPSIKADLTLIAEPVLAEPNKNGLYEGSKPTPVTQVNYLGSKLDEGTDYRVSYSYDLAKGTATYTIKGGSNGIFTGAYTGTFKLAEKASWEKVNGKWKLHYGDTYVKNQWLEIGGSWYHFDANGYAQTGWTKLGGSWYYFESSGAMVTGWEQIGGAWYYFAPSNGAMQTGWFAVDGSWYHASGSGAMQTGWLKDGGKWYYLGSSGAMTEGWKKIDGTWYYFAPGSGAMKTGWFAVDGSWYHASGSGAMQTGWLKDGGTWYYLGSSGAMAEGWKKLGGTWYYLTPGSGAMKTGWFAVDGAWYYASGSGAMQKSCWVGNYYLTSSGAMATNTWIGRYHVNASGLWDDTK
ncbi:N-acetylmuramoyl-L-alanine amidase family protein [Xiamenia xianingshaonis]|uniref:N-acetylmuramoyl-L-alanine amidase family protein n=1 Tax=Xiamenia xianingshaonis TaxID=2682776 RepID=A0A9E6SU36_9ACTN|nr:N-acetylmuramoyl-L-alanine amidase family protein [Xiamenia xianingshaonis]NHM14291.1 hypothetical protein [Xiamenia xianingshaonis]QTU84100.1 N-acetylmuramoyl-L-alanine amidase family protein [Xiamenia xianingshaonis]